jgi:hypothetical protein
MDLNKIYIDYGWHPSDGDYNIEKELFRDKKINAIREINFYKILKLFSHIFKNKLFALKRKK